MTVYEKIEELTKDIKSYITSNVEIFKLEAVELFSVIGASFISSLIIGVVVFLFMIFLSLSAGFYFSSLLGNNYAGFAIVAGFYLTIAIILIIGRGKLVEKPLQNKIIRKIFNKK
ncbi:MAG TPA: phage holin family protein [Prolixibacteraceae bacterium]|nr:phage holin family protein [Prolixibacteraceae bacterium]